jgi:membrane protease YdiL (CAAX protease family)
MTDSGGLAPAYVMTVSLADTVIVLGLVVIFLLVHGERPRDIVLGTRGIAREAVVGLWLTPVALMIAATVLLTSQRLAPWLHTVARNPLQDILESPRDVWLFALVVVFAGGIREEIQRAFILHRFSVWLGGTTFGLVVTTIAFGAGHLTQGLDAALAIGLIGLLWGIAYVRRRSAIAPIVSHSGFDLLQIAQFVLNR